MTEIAFHFNLPDKLAYACRLLRKACTQGKSVGVLAPPDVLHDLDQRLWTFSALDFVPHCLAGAASGLAAVSPVVLTSDSAALTESGVLVHAGLALPVGFERFKRLIELVGTSDEERAAARQRWRHYAERGYTVTSSDFAQRRARLAQ